MKVLLVRHSIAVDPYAAPSDAHRWLTAAGRARAVQVAAAIAERAPITHVFTSPYVRAVQTAELLAQGLGFSGELRVHADLAAEFGTTAQALACLDALPESAVAMLVTHMPKVRAMTAALSGDDDVAGFHTCTVACVVPDRGVQWRHDP